MAIIEHTFYGIKCDGCGQSLPNEWNNPAFYDSKNTIEDIAKESGWLEIRGKHYCEDCHRYGDDDELILGDGTIIKQEEDDWI